MPRNTKKGTPSMSNKSSPKNSLIACVFFSSLSRTKKDKILLEWQARKENINIHIKITIGVFFKNFTALIISLIDDDTLFYPF